MLRSFFAFALLLVSVLPRDLLAQQINPDSTASLSTPLVQRPIPSNAFTETPLRKSIIVPGLLITFGAFGTGNEEVKELNDEVREELAQEHPHKSLHLDNWMQHLPAATVVALSLAGVPGRHTLGDRSKLFMVSNLFMASTVFTTKKWTAQLRPDGSNHYSFPSGHTAESFANAEFLRLEYGASHPWIGVAGYAMAAATGYLRMYNNKHWLSDVVAGAGVGILSTRFAFWLYPRLKKNPASHSRGNFVVAPSFMSNGPGVGVSYIPK